MAKPFSIYLIHHSHTDIGYTDVQEKIENDHIDYIAQAVDVLNAAHSERPEWLGFKWNCESFWAVERFLERAPEKHKEDFLRYVRSGEIGLSGSYLNMTELADGRTLYEIYSRCRRYMKKYCIAVRSAMTADINGYSWGTADALYENGITRLLSCIHTVHGGFPLEEKQNPFFWVSPKGNRILAWSSDHYLLGNELGISGMPSYEYTIRDGLDASEPDPRRRAEKRIEAYVASLRERGYKLDFAPVTVSGAMADNCFPNAYTVEFCREYNAAHGDVIYIRPSTLDEFFDEAEKHADMIPEYSGDWTDWWADGVGSIPEAVSLSRQAARVRGALCRLDPEHSTSCKKLFDSAEYDLALFAEHTWGAAQSVSRPWDPVTSELESRKVLYAHRAAASVGRALEAYKRASGETASSLLRSDVIKAINPASRRVDGIAQIRYINLAGYTDFEIRDSLGNSIPYQIKNGEYLVMQISLGAGETGEYRMIPVPADAVNSAEMPELSHEDGTYGIRTDFFDLKIKEGNGLSSVFDLKKGTELIRGNAKLPPFTPIYEVTEDKRITSVRAAMKRARRSDATETNAGRLTDIRVSARGPVFTEFELHYELKGASDCSVVLTAYKSLPRIDAEIRINKESVLFPENLYLTLPFTAPGDSELWIEKSACVLRPRIDQIPGTCAGFYLIQNGLSFTGERGSTVIATPDAPLISMAGEEGPGLPVCSGHGAKNSDEVYSWLMNNFWETNFKASLGGVRRFAFSLISTDETDPHGAILCAEEANTGFFTFHSFKEERD